MLLCRTSISSLLPKTLQAKEENIFALKAYQEDVGIQVLNDKMETGEGTKSARLNLMFGRLNIEFCTFSEELFTKYYLSLSSASSPL